MSCRIDMTLFCSNRKVLSLLGWLGHIVEGMNKEKYAKDSLDLVSRNYGLLDVESMEMDYVHGGEINDIWCREIFIRRVLYSLL